MDDAIASPAASVHPRWDPWLMGAVALGAALRLYQIARSDFPLNDGGLFVMMIDGLTANHYVPPLRIPWAQYELPFAYPPFAFYLAAATGQLTGIATVELLRLLPFLGSTGALIAFAGLARAYLASRVAVVASVVAFGLVPDGYYWVISGGGLTRSFGVAFSLFALHQLLLLFRHPTRSRFAAASIGSALTVLTHPESATLFAASALLLTVSYGRSLKGLQSAAAVAIATLVITAPWWVMVLSRYGFDPFRKGGGNAFGVAVIRFALSEGGIGVAIGGVFGLLTLAMCWFALRGWFASAWSIAGILFSRNFHQYSMPAMALLLGTVAERCWSLPPKLFRSGPDAQAPVFSAIWAAQVGSLALLAFAFVQATNPLHFNIPTLARGERDAMAWIDGHTPPGARFLLLTTMEQGGVVDPTGDWFAALSGRRGLSPPQGTEWIGKYDETAYAYADLQLCRSRDTTCLEHWAADERVEFEYVYVPVPTAVVRSEEPSCCREVLRSLTTDPAYRLVYDGAGASVFERLERVAP